MDTIKTGRYIANQRKLLRITQRELADMLGVTNRTVSKWETGTGMPDIGILPVLAEVLGTTIDCILRGEDSEISGEVNVDFESAGINGGTVAEMKKEISSEEKKIAKYMIDKQIMQFRIEGMVSVTGGIVSIVAFFVLSQFISMTPAFVGGLLIDGIAFIAFLVFFYHIQQEVRCYNESFSGDIYFRKIWRTYAIAGIWIWTAVPTLFTVYMALSLTFGLNRIAYGIIWSLLYVAICASVTEEKFHQ